MKTQYKSGYKGILIFGFKLAILILLLLAIYKQLFKHQNLEELLSTFEQSLNLKCVLLCLLTLLLSVLNFSCETQKWRILMNKFFDIKFIEAFKAILVGSTISIFTPNRIGEYGGRALFIPKKWLVETVAATIIGSISQMMVVLSGGFLAALVLNTTSISIQILNKQQFWVLMALSVTIISFLTLLYFRLNWVAKVISGLNFFKKWLSKLQIIKKYNLNELISVQAWSFLKYTIFTVQFLLLLLAFNIPFSLSLILLIMFTFLIQTLIPTVAVLEIGIRGNVALLTFGVITNNTIGILTASLLLWTINLMIPAILGSVLLFKTKYNI